jgi:hypothetical protein
LKTMTKQSTFQKQSNTDGKPICAECYHEEEQVKK